MEDEMSTEDVFPLLELPAGVETVLLPFVASGTGGLQALLNLRPVCSTTKSWVDNIPPGQGKPLFSKSQVRMDSDVNTIKRFFESPPSSAVSGLSVNIKAILDKNPPAEEEELWTKFCTFWAPRLETLELRNEPIDCVNQIFDNNRRISCLLESPNLQVLRLAAIRIPWNMSTTIPSSLYKVKELSINFTGPYEENEEQKHFYSKLKNNPNLRKLETVIHSGADFKCLQNLIDAKKEDEQLEMNLHLAEIFTPDESYDEDDMEINNDVYLQLAESVLSSKSTIRLQMSEYIFSLDYALDFLPRHIALEMFEKVESVKVWTPSEDTMSLLESLPRLKQVTVESECYGNGFGRRLDELTFPPSLEDLSFTKGFPARAALPESLKSLTLKQFSCSLNELVSSLNLLKTRCTGLENLYISWKCRVSEAAAVEIQKSPGFANLRSLTFDFEPYESDAETCRVVLLRGFQLETLKLSHLALRFKRFDFNGHFYNRVLNWRGYLSALDAPFLTALCQGAIGNSLLTFHIEEEAVTPDGLLLLARLKSLTAENMKSLEEREGRGRCQRKWSLIELPKFEDPRKLLDCICCVDGQ